MRRADHLTNSERALTLALVLVAAGCAPAGIPHRDVLLPRSASTTTAPAPAAMRQEAAQPGERRTASHEVELLARTPAAPSGASSRTGARPTTPYSSLFLAPPSQRGPPALG